MLGSAKKCCPVRRGGGGGGQVLISELKAACCVFTAWTSARHILVWWHRYTQPGDVECLGKGVHHVHCSQCLLLPARQISNPGSCTAGMCLYWLGVGVEDPQCNHERLAACGSTSPLLSCWKGCLCS